MDCHAGCLALFTVLVAKKCRELEDARAARIAKQLTAAKTAAIQQLQPELEPVLMREGLEWTDVEPALEAYEILEKLQDALADPSPFLEEIAGSSQALAKKLAILRLRKQLEPLLGRAGCDWSDVESLIKACEADELTAALSDPAEFFDKLAETSDVLNRKLARGRLKLALEPVVLAQGLDWNCVQPAIDTIRDVNLLNSAISDPGAFLEIMAEANEPLNQKLAIARLKPELEPLVVKDALAWSDVEPALCSIDNIEILTAARTDPTEFFSALKERHEPLAKQIAVLKLRPELEPVASKEGLAWSEVQSAIDEFSNVEKIKHAVSFPAAFLKDLASSGTPRAEKIADQLKVNRQRAEAAKSPKKSDAGLADTPRSAKSQVNPSYLFQLAHVSSAAMNRRAKT